MTLTLQLSDEQVSVLNAKALAEGFSSVEAWIESQAEPMYPIPDPEKPLRSAADIVLFHMSQVPPEIMANMPTDGASQHDHYIYGTPKRAV